VHVSLNILPELAEYIKSRIVVEFEELKTRFPGRSESSFRRDSSKLECVTCFTDNSKYSTLPDIPDYDGFGLWQYGAIRFSKHGTIKETARVLIGGSACGLSHTDLSDILGIPLYNPLRALLKEGAVTCETDGHRMTFFSGDDEAGKRQRSNSPGAVRHSADHPFNLHVTIDLLLAVLLENEDTADKAYLFLKADKYPDITRKEVDEIFGFYRLAEKKTKSEAS
jgi:hypothetical protein